ncbi:uncharacterized protein LOC113894661 [Bos indicus x Bos taurus]|uniref:uncharacterized protein LOC113894661 n=1 Tax=Bos indicus x Bos taurus TaxID=30522 RepID=UPI000F7D2D90|nr:uncharacterized protein LOC113894661 [Bos indicus x Bos taurus]
MSAGRDTDLTCCVPTGSLPRQGISEGPSWQEPRPPPAAAQPVVPGHQQACDPEAGATRSAVGSSVHEHLPGSTRSSWPWAQQGQTRLVTALVESAFWLGVSTGRSLSLSQLWEVMGQRPTGSSEPGRQPPTIIHPHAMGRDHQGPAVGRPGGPGFLEERVCREGASLLKAAPEAPPAPARRVSGCRVSAAGPGGAGCTGPTPRRGDSLTVTPQPALVTRPPPLPGGLGEQECTLALAQACLAPGAPPEPDTPSPARDGLGRQLLEEVVLGLAGGKPAIKPGGLEPVPQVFPGPASARPQWPACRQAWPISSQTAPNPRGWAGLAPARLHCPCVLSRLHPPPCAPTVASRTYRVPRLPTRSSASHTPPHHGTQRPSKASRGPPSTVTGMAGDQRFSPGGRPLASATAARLQPGRHRRPWVPTFLAPAPSPAPSPSDNKER